MCFLFPMQICKNQPSGVTNTRQLHRVARITKITRFFFFFGGGGGGGYTFCLFFWYVLGSQRKIKLELEPFKFVTCLRLGALCQVGLKGHQKNRQNPIFGPFDTYLLDIPVFVFWCFFFGVLFGEVFLGGRLLVGYPGTPRCIRQLFLKHSPTPSSKPPCRLIFRSGILKIGIGAEMPGFLCSPL